jgi:hypothetical protein
MIAFDDPHPSVPWLLPPTLLSDRDRFGRLVGEALGDR